MADRIGQQLGHYQLIRFIGKGSFAAVYLGKHDRLGTHAAVKVLHAQLGSEEEERFQEEAQLVARLAHPHIIHLLDFAVEDGVPFLAMDYAPNGTLRQQFPNGEPQAPGAILPFVWQVADALHYAHGQRVIHRDVKPENILLDEHHQVLLSDFGIAVVSQSARYQTSQEILGAATYLAPEQIEAFARPASDQYALATIVYEWLSGAPPFEGSTKEVMAKHLFTEPPSLRERVRTISPAIEAVIMGALSKDPLDRFPNVATFAAAFEEACQAMPVLLFVPPRLVETDAEAQNVTDADAAPEPPDVAADAPDEPALPEPAPAPEAAPMKEEPPLPEPPAAPEKPDAPAHTPDEQHQAAPAPARDEPVLLEPPPPAAQHWAGPAPAAQQPAGPPLIIGPARAYGEWDMPPEQATAARVPAAFSPAMPPAVEALPANPKPHLGPTWREVNWMPPPAAPGAAPLLPPSEPPGGRLSRRSVLLGGAAGLAVVAGALTWLGVSELHNSPSHSSGVTRSATPRPSPTAAQTPTPTPTPIPAPGVVLYTYSGHSGFVRGVAWSPNGKRIASASDDYTVQVWDAMTGAAPLTYKGHSREVRAVAWSPDGKYLASGSQDQTLQVWDAATGKTLHTFTFGHWVTTVAWSPNGKYLAAGSWDYTAQVWNTATWQRIDRFATPGWVNAVAWSPDSVHLATGDGAKLALTWNALTGNRLINYRGHTGAVLALAWASDGRHIVSGADLPDTTVQYWNTGNAGRIWRANIQDQASSLAWSYSGKRLAAGGSKVYLLDPATGEQLFSYPRDGASLTWSPDDKYIASGGKSTTVEVWQAS